MLSVVLGPLETGPLNIFLRSLQVMDCLGATCSTFYKLQERTCAEMVAKYDAKDAFEMFAELQNTEVDESEYLRNAVSRFVWFAIIEVLQC